MDENPFFGCLARASLSNSPPPSPHTQAHEQSMHPVEVTEPHANSQQMDEHLDLEIIKLLEQDAKKHAQRNKPRPSIRPNTHFLSRIVTETKRHNDKLLGIEDKKVRGRGNKSRGAHMDSYFRGATPEKATDSSTLRKDPPRNAPRKSRSERRHSLDRKQYSDSEHPRKRRHSSSERRYSSDSSDSPETSRKYTSRTPACSTRKRSSSPVRSRSRSFRRKRSSSPRRRRSSSPRRKPSQSPRRKRLRSPHRKHRRSSSSSSDRYRN
jgi:hypothetical protein